MASTSSSGAPAWSHKTVRTAIRLLIERLESKGRSNIHRQDSISRSEGRRDHSHTDVQNTLTTAAMELERI